MIIISTINKYSTKQKEIFYFLESTYTLFSLGNHKFRQYLPSTRSCSVLKDRY